MLINWENQLAVSENWAGKISNVEEKYKLARKVSQYVKNGQVIGAGSGSTSFLAVKAIAERVREESLDILVIPTSQEALLNCSVHGLKTTTLAAEKPDWAFDGADEFDSNKRLIKGRGGAMFAEKLVMASAPKTYILADESKRVARLGEKSAVPIEVDPRAVHLVETRLQSFPVQNVQMRLAGAKDGPIVTEAGNLILDVRFLEISNSLEMELSSIPGIVESGLFTNYSVEILSE